MGRLGNQLWILSAGIKKFGEGNFKVVYSNHGRYTQESYEQFVQSIGSCLTGVEFKPEPDEGDNIMPLGYYQHKKWLVDAEVMRRHIRAVDDVPHLKAVIHIRLGDYLHVGTHKPFIITREYLERKCGELGLPLDQFVVMSDSPSKVREMFGEDLRVHEESDTLRAFWTLCNADYLIGSMSSFSYWAAYLGQHKGVAFPDEWFFDKCDGTFAQSLDDLLWYK